MSGQHSERAHALLGASKASQWLNCPPSARLQDSIPDKRSAFADQGTAAHEYSELLLQRFNYPFTVAELVRHEAEIERFIATNKFYDAEMESAVQAYVDVVEERFNEAKARSVDAVLLLEERLNFSEWVPGGFGTGDVLIISDGVLEVIDLKYGKGIPVSAVGNSQMRLYALGAWTAYSYLYDLKEIHMTICQPRLDSVSTDTMAVEELLDWAENTVKPAAKLANAGDGDFKSGEHCRFCKVKGNCRARSDANMALIAHEFKSPPLLELDEISGILAVAEHLQSWAKDVQAYAFDQAKSGQRIPGHKLVAGRSNRTILDKEAAIEKLAAATSVQVGSYLKPPELLGIGELEKRIGKTELVDLIGNLIVKPPGKPTLVPDSDKRQEINSVDGDFSGEAFDDADAL